MKKQGASIRNILFSYRNNEKIPKSQKTFEDVVTQRGFEPRTPCLKAIKSCNIHTFMRLIVFDTLI